MSNHLEVVHGATAEQIELLKSHVLNEMFIHNALFYDNEIEFPEISDSDIEDVLAKLVNLKIKSDGNITYDSVDNENEKFIVYQKPNGDFTHETIRTSEYEKNLVLAEIKKILEEQGAEAVSEYINKNYKPLFN